MALPSSRDTTYVAGVTPYIKANDLNDIQNYIVHVFQGTRTLKALQIDGTSNNATTVANGALMVSRTVVSGTYPSTAVAVGEYNRDGAPAAIAQLSGGFIPPLGAGGQGLTMGYGIKALNRLGAGNYEVTFLRQPTAGSADNCCVQVTPWAAAGYATVSVAVVAGDLVATIVLSAGADLPFFVTAWIW